MQKEIDEGRHSNNIPRSRGGVNFYEEDRNLQYLMRRYLPASMHGWADRELSAFGALAGGPVDERAAYTDGDGKPILRKYNRLGEDISEIVLNDGYLKTVREVYGTGIVGYLYRDIPSLGRPAPFLYSYLQGYLLSQSEPGFYCPVTLTMSAAFLIDRFGNAWQKDHYLSGLIALDREHLYEGATWLTERQGGSDVGANLTVAEETSDEGVYRLTGEKFFASNAGAMVATVLARVNHDTVGTKGLGLFIVPWILPDGTKNRVKIRRLKEKLGVNAVPSAEVILDEAEGYLIGEASSGFKYMAEALNISRICNSIASVGIMRRAFSESLHYTSERQAFGKSIVEYAMVKKTLAQMLVECEVNTGACFEMIRYFDKVHTSRDATADEEGMARLLIPLLKYRTGECAKEAAHQAIEMHGGNGYIEEYVTPRLLRDAQVLSVWEGPANILALDVLRVMKKRNGHEIFFRIIKREIERLTHPQSTPFKQRLSESIQEMRETASILLKQPEDILTYHLKDFADGLIDLFETVTILKEAEDQAKKDGNLRKFIVARLFVNIHSERKKTFSDEPEDLKFFWELVKCEKIE
ncbi:MAG TPA: acyl-CoA dehydrogenase family protein [Bacillales bacterium]|nr:acyl-CoA dehydrogenase family protein [Bacillales bacterium]